VGIIFYQSGTQRVFECFSVLYGYVGDRFHSVKVFGQTNRQASRPEFHDETPQKVQQRGVNRGVG
jgi:hypothetical protein